MELRAFFGDGGGFAPPESLAAGSPVTRGDGDSRRGIWIECQDKVGLVVSLQSPPLRQCREGSQFLQTAWTQQSQRIEVVLDNKVQTGNSSMLTLVPSDSTSCTVHNATQGERVSISRHSAH